MLRVMNELGDRMLAAFVPRATAAAADCGSAHWKNICKDNVWQFCRCWSNSNCKCDACDPSTHRC
ncbi:hypothetical protein I0C86_14925 [Plantactinospora sp. S1510]|uniref:CRC domain-containing protein n=1 Tax=Plantactinospora alkalitolerans TaxID=2789879 RepID=A0ABS0GW77_9ACTN|nr:hypothetical protein [Plantactinospora alkalitolerans]MBF9130238.1 hypothetical protein [Plantactinospora alkalitolerans]